MIAATEIANALGVNKKSVTDLVQKKIVQLEKWGSVERISGQSKGRPTVDYLLNDNQAVYLILSSRVNDDIRFKAFNAIENKTVNELISSIDLDDDLLDRYVYLIQCTETGNKKIGVSKDPLKRLASLQTSNAGKLEIVFKVRAKDAYRLEKDAHSKFASHRKHGEWFGVELNNKEVINYVS
jgi:hypothetical protein